VSPGATKVKILSAYRKLSKKFHPDIQNNLPVAERDPQAVEKFKEVSEAYRALSGPKRQAEEPPLDPEWVRNMIERIHEFETAVQRAQEAEERKRKKEEAERERQEAARHAREQAKAREDLVQVVSTIVEKLQIWTAKDEPLSH
jgi:curved DNA-binding protein CbpA